MERRGGKDFGNNGVPGTNGKPMTPKALDNLAAELTELANAGQEAMRDGRGLTLPSGRKSTKVLRNGRNEQPSL